LFYCVGKIIRVAAGRDGRLFLQTLPEGWPVRFAGCALQL